MLYNMLVTQQIETIAKCLEDLKLKGKHDSNVGSCNFCGVEHPQGACMMVEDATIGLQQVNCMSNFSRLPNQGNFYQNQGNSGWRNNHNYSWKKPARQYQKPPQSLEGEEQANKSSPIELALEKLTTHTSTFFQQTSNFMTDTKTNQKNNEASLRNLESQLGQLAKQVAERTAGTFPSNTEEPNQKNQCNMVVCVLSTSTKDDIGSLNLNLKINDMSILNSLCDSGSNVNLMPFSFYRTLGVYSLKPTTMKLKLANQLVIQPFGVIENVGVHVGNQVIPTDFVVSETLGEQSSQVILGRTFLKNGNFILDFSKGEASSQTCETVEKCCDPIDLNVVINFYDGMPSYFVDCIGT